MGLKSLSASGFFKKKYELGDCFYDEEGKQLEKSKVWIMLKEPSTFEMNKFGDNKDQNIKLLMDLMPKCVIAHGGFGEDDGSEPTNEEVGKFLVGRANVFYILAEEWQQDLPFVQKRQQKSKEQAAASSSTTQ